MKVYLSKTIDIAIIFVSNFQSIDNHNAFACSQRNGAAEEEMGEQFWCHLIHKLNQVTVICCWLIDVRVRAMPFCICIEIPTIGDYKSLDEDKWFAYVSSVDMTGNYCKL